MYQGRTRLIRPDPTHAHNHYPSMPGYARRHACRSGKIDFLPASRYFLNTTGNRGSRFILSGVHLNSAGLINNKFSVSLRGWSMTIGLESDLRRQIADLETKISEYEGLLYHHEPGWNALKQSDASYQAIFENTGTGAFVKEADMTISKVNSEFERLTGYSKADIEGEMKWTDFFLEEDHDRLAGYHADRRTATSDAPRNLECRIRDSPRDHQARLFDPGPDSGHPQEHRHAHGHHEAQAGRGPDSGKQGLSCGHRRELRRADLCGFPGFENSISQ
jgi:PAS domain S-box-containing protein